MVCLPQETYRSFVSQSSPELTAPRLTAGTNVLVYQPPSLGEDANEKIVPDPEPVVARHGAWK
jgi:hypothetical protein